VQARSVFPGVLKKIKIEEMKELYQALTTEIKKN
jgi:hypothetical protein